MLCFSRGQCQEALVFKERLVCFSDSTDRISSSSSSVWSSIKEESLQTDPGSFQDYVCQIRSYGGQILQTYWIALDAFPVLKSNPSKQFPRALLSRFICSDHSGSDIFLWSYWEPDETGCQKDRPRRWASHFLDCLGCFRERVCSWCRSVHAFSESRNRINGRQHATHSYLTPGFQDRPVNMYFVAGKGKTIIAEPAKERVEPVISEFASRRLNWPLTILSPSG